MTSHVYCRTKDYSFEFLQEFPLLTWKYKFYVQKISMSNDEEN